MEQLYNFLPSYINNILVWIIGVGGVAINYVSNNIRRDVLALIVFIIIDFATGLLNGSKDKNINSKVMSRGVKKKIGMVFYIIVANVLDRLLIPGSFWFTTLIVYVLIANELLSITENVGKLGVPIPKAWVNKLTQLKKIGDVESIEEAINILAELLNVNKKLNSNDELHDKMNDIYEILENEKLTDKDVNKDGEGSNK